MKTLHLVPGYSKALELQETALEGVCWWGPPIFRDGPFAEVVAWWGEHVSRYEDEAAEVLEHGERTLARLATADRVVVWAGTHLDEQAFLVWGVRALRGMLGSERLLLNVVDDEIGIGVLEAAELEARHAPRTLDVQTLALLDGAWAALAAPTPEPLGALLARWGSELPCLRRALDLVRFRFPDAATGLNVWEHDLLSSVERVGPRAARICGQLYDPTAEELEDAYPRGDLVVWTRLVDFGEGSRPLVQLTGDVEQGMRAVSAELTDDGRAVLQGRANALDLIDYDTWVFGVHLDPRGGGPVWVRDGDRLRPR
jgi:hypothetical protein